MIIRPRNPILRCLTPCLRNIRRQYLSSKSSLFTVSEEVQDALQTGRPVVALETTIYTHGFPYPENVALASHLESIVRVHGAVPATIGILDGKAVVGLNAEQLYRLISSGVTGGTVKTSRRDLAYVCGLGLTGRKLNGGTTVAATMVLAHLAGIRVFATGGLGGVHRGAESTMDISADLTELGRTPIGVISSGCKGFLDIPRTLEYLETQGVGVATFADGRNGEVDYPAFWSRDSGFRSPMTISDEKEAAAMIYAQSTIPITSALHFANPAPESFSIAKSDMEGMINEAIKSAIEIGAGGKDNTPFILARIKELSGGKSVEVNRALIEANVARGAMVARELAKLEGNNSRTITEKFPMSETSNPSSMMFDTHDHSDTLQGLQHILPSESQPDSEIMAVDVVVAGSIAVDTSCDYSPVPRSEQVVPQLHVSNPSMVFQSIGGVGYNVSKAAQSLGASVKLCSAIGTDAIGHVALDMLSSEELSTKSVRMLDHAQNNRTAQYVAVNNAHNELVLAMADMRILEDVSADVLDVWMKELTLTKPKWLVVDANWKPHVIHQWLHKGKAQRCFTAFEPVSAAKAGRLFSSPQKLDVFPSQTLDLITPNQHELAALHHAASATGAFERPDWWAVIDALGLPATGSRAAFAAATSVSLVDAGIPQQSVQLLPFIPTVVTTLGERGILLTMLLRPEDPRLDGGHEAAPWILSRGQRGDGDMNVGGVYMRLFEPPEVLTPGMLTSVNGVGDTLTGVLVAGLATTGKGVELLLEVAQKAAAMTLRSKKSVSPSLGALRNCLKEMA